VVATEEKKKSARKDRVIYAEPEVIVRKDKRTALLYAAGAFAGFGSICAIIGVTVMFYIQIFWMFVLLMGVGLIFCLWEVYIWIEQYICRTRFRVFENALVPSYIPASYALRRKEYAVPFSRLRGMSFSSRKRRGKAEWRCDLLLDDGRMVELYGLESEKGFYNFLKDVKETYVLPDLVSPETGEDDMKNKLRKGYQEQLKRWGIKPKGKR